jgi:Amt family ammonium transporter
VGLLAGKTTTFLHHLMALVIVSAFSFGVSLLLFWITNLFVSVRVSAEDEIVGLDISQHAEHLTLVPAPAPSTEPAAGGLRSA